MKNIQQNSLTKLYLHQSSESLLILFQISGFYNKPIDLGLPTVLETLVNQLEIFQSYYQSGNEGFNPIQQYWTDF